ncbi:MAG: aspartate carbamoyltransferase [Candidatus Omnitrophica bacterium]|nr:aspartate carbamoyltransferase [Candidatus Omnitrophota bacterium]
MANLLSLKNFSKEKIEKILNDAYFLERNQTALQNKYKSKILTLAFFEPSTRTKLSFSAAAYKIGLDVLDYSSHFSSEKKGESISDTIKILEGYSDCIVIRHWDEKIFQTIQFSCPIINAGNGIDEHPTQALIDLYTIKKEFGKIDGLNFLIVGDLKNGRTVHSLLLALRNYNVSVNLFCPNQLSLDKEFLSQLEGKLRISYSKNFELENIDVLYMTRIQYERFKSKKPKDLEKSYSLNLKLLKKAKDSLIILHPLPRLAELPTEIDKTKHAKYFLQAKNAIFVRMAILDYCLCND